MMDHSFQKTTEVEFNLFFRMEGEVAERYGFVGYLRADYGQTGREFWTTWFDSQPDLKTKVFHDEFGEIINYLRDASQGPIEGPDVFKFHCLQNMRFRVTDTDVRFKIVTEGFSYYFRCHPQIADYNLYCMVFDNRFLLPELERVYALPRKCFGIHPETGERVLIRRGLNTMERFDSAETPDELRLTVDRDNARWGVTPEQEAAMLERALEGRGAPDTQRRKNDKEAR